MFLDYIFLFSLVIFIGFGLVNNVFFKGIYDIRSYDKESLEALLIKGFIGVKVN